MGDVTMPSQGVQGSSDMVNSALVLLVCEPVGYPLHTLLAESHISVDESGPQTGVGACCQLPQGLLPVLLNGLLQSMKFCWGLMQGLAGVWQVVLLQYPSHKSSIPALNGAHRQGIGTMNTSNSAHCFFSGNSRLLTELNFSPLTFLCIGYICTTTVTLRKVSF